MRDVADNLPKPMIPVGNKPILWHIMKYYSTFGFTEFVLCLGYKSNVIKEYFVNYEINTSDFTLSLGDKHSLDFMNQHNEKDWKITFAETGENAMTGARIKKIKKYIPEGEQFMLTYGGGLSDVDINKLIEFHKASGKAMTLTAVRPPGRFGEIMSDPTGQITEFNEKPNATEGRINGGYFVCNYNMFDFIEDGDDVVFEQDPIRKMVKHGELMQFNHDQFWQPMDTYREYSLLNEIYANNKAPWKKW
ncbi:glucose-1-phosphate cytidylyltransferase [Pedobacter sp. ASV12]|uniref:glucose-1-phosphate cytidylyltransferase n=1 Tax=Pedobacter sp. ASV12 TaxID=2795120 RepID=UPI00351C008C